MSSNRPLAIRKRYGPAPPKKQEATTSVPLLSQVQAEMPKPPRWSALEPDYSLPVSIRNGEPVGRFTNINKIRRTRNKSNIRQVKKTRVDTLEFLLGKALSAINDFNSKYRKPEITSLSIDQFLPIIGQVQDKYNKAMLELEDYQRVNAPILAQAAAAAQSDRHQLPLYQELVRQYNAFVMPRNEYADDLFELNEDLSILYEDIPKLMHNLNSIRRLEQNIAEPVVISQAAAAAPEQTEFPPPSPSNSLIFGSLEGGGRRKRKTRRSK